MTRTPALSGLRIAPRAALTGTLFCLCVALGPRVAGAQTPIDAGYRDFDYGTQVTSMPTGDKPESKLWWTDGLWWGVLWNPGADSYEIHRLDLPAQSWNGTGTLVDSRSNAKVDALWDGTRLYVLTHVFSNSPGQVSAGSAGRLYRYSYDVGTKVYTLDSGYPVTVNSSRSETLVLDKDSGGRLWITWVEGGKVKVNRTVGNDQTWGTPFDLPVQGANLNSDDIASVVAFGGTKIGIMWSNQNDKKMYFAVHLDENADTQWQPREDALADGSRAVADDHINLKQSCEGDGAVYAATKTSLSGSDPLTYLLKRTASGSWSRHVFGTGSNNHTRPIVLLNGSEGRAYVFASSNRADGREKIYMKSAPTNALQFPSGLGTPFIDSPNDQQANNPTSTKQCLGPATGLLVLSSDQTSHHYLHNHLALTGGAPPTIASFTPTSGAAGAVVTITGTGFLGTTAVSFNGAAASPFTVDSDVEVRATVPATATSGVIGVTTPAGTATSTASFTVVPSPVITFFAPTSGPEGVLVDVHGAHFASASGVAFGGAAAGFSIVSDTLLRATVPAGAPTGRITVTNPDGTGTSATDFVVVVPPNVTSFAPPSGPVGTVVTITGTGFLGTTAVTFNGSAPSPFTVDSNVQIRATVPSGATTGRIEVGNAAGSAQSATDFVVTPPPPITNFAPVHDAQVYSANATTNYGALTSLRVKNEANDYNSYLKFEVSGIGSSVQSATLRLYCTDESPAGGAIYLVSNDYQSTTTPWVESGLTWDNAPVIGGSPVAPSQAVATNAWAEYDVTAAIQGSGTFSFGVMSNSHNSAYYNSKEATTNRPVLVIEASLGPVIASFTPGNGVVGTVVTISGSNFIGVTGVTFNGTAASIFTVDSPSQIHATVPSGATTGPIAVGTSDGTGQSGTPFTVILPPSITSFLPGSGAVETMVTIQGSNFAGVTTVKFNDTAASVFTVDSPSQIRATVPAGATTGRIEVLNLAGTAVSSSDFAVLYPPRIASFSPASGLVGSEVTIDGSNFVGVTGVTFNGAAASAYTVDSPGQIHATVPDGATTGAIGVVNGDGTGQSATNFTVVLPPSIASFTPGSGPVGTVVSIHGDNFAGVNAVSFNGTAATTLTVASNVLIQATVPTGAATGRVEVTNAAASAQGATDFVVTVPPPIVSFAPVHDAQVSSASATTNYGALGSLRVKNEANDYDSYLKFEVSGVGPSVERATLRLYCTDESPDGGAIYLVSNDYPATTTPWVESGLTWNNAPAISGSPVAPSQTAATNAWVEYDVTAAFQGDGTYSFGVMSNHSNSAYYNSKEAATNRPELVVESGSGGPSPPVITSFTPGIGPEGTEVTIDGSSFVGVTGVSFNATAALVFTVESPHRIRATVPSGATTGRIEVATGAGSAQSATDFVVGTPPPIVSFAPVHDAQVYSANATTNYGALTSLRVKNEANDYNSYLKFEVTGLGGPVQSAKLWLYCTDESPDGGAIYLVSNDYQATTTPWVESGLTWNNAPAISGSPVAPAQAVATNAWVEYDVTTAFQGSGTYSFGVMSNSHNSAYYSSKESSTNPPQLVIQAGSPTPAATASMEHTVEETSPAPVAELHAIPRELALGPTYPNPFHARASIRYQLPRPGNVRLIVYDLMGRAVRILMDARAPAGVHEVSWDGRDDAGHAVHSGVYLLRFETDEFTATRRLLRLR